MYRKYIKRLLDIVLSLIGLILFSPIFLIVSILVFIFLGYPVLFKQKRPGKNEKIFTLYKFRTMTDKKDKNGNLLPDEERLTKFGKFLRKTSLDEIPEFINILKGDMSFIGPRPLLVKYLDYYTDEERHRHDVRPGLTGLAQVSGRNLLTWDARFKKDIEYVNNVTFINDIKIVFKTVIKVLKQADIASGKENIMLSLNQERDYNLVKIDNELFSKYKNDLQECLKCLETLDTKTRKTILENMQKYINDKTAIVYGYKTNEHLVGFIWGYKISDDTIHINYFVVLEKYRSKGIGLILLTKLLNCSKEYNIIEVELLVNKTNKRAIKFYERNGFSTSNMDKEKYKMKRSV